MRNLQRPGFGPRAAAKTEDGGCGEARKRAAASDQHGVSLFVFLMKSTFGDRPAAVKKFVVTDAARGRVGQGLLPNINHIAACRFQRQKIVTILSTN